MINAELCPFCGEEIKIEICDERGYIQDPGYEMQPARKGEVKYGLFHSIEEHPNCPIANEDEFRVIGCFVYDSQEDAEAARSCRAKEREST